MNNIQEKRDYVSRQYGGSWPCRVALMSDWQVSQIYRRMTVEKKLKKDRNAVKGGEQLCMFDILEEEKKNDC